MYFTGNTYKSIPRTQYLGFEFSNIYLSNTGAVEVGFSGESANYSVLISGNKVFDSSRKYIYSNSEAFDISGTINSGTSQLFINGLPLKIKSGVADYYNSFFVSLNGANLNSDILVAIPQVSYNVSVSSAITSLGNLQVSVQNSSPSNFKIYDYSIQFSDNTENLTMPQFSGTISGIVSGNTTKTFSLADVSNIEDSRGYAFDLTLNTNLGTIINSYSGSILSGYNSFISALTKTGIGASVPVLFFGETGLNSFSFLSNSANSFSSLQIGKYDLLTEKYTSGTASMIFEPISPADGATILSEYITGIAITSTGLYSSCPEVSFSEYYYVNGLTLDSQTILSTGCTGTVRLKFSGIGAGTGASGVLLVLPQVITDGVVYATGGSFAYYLSATGYTITNPGSGYTGVPAVTLDLSSAGVGCYDYALASGNKYPYSAFSGTPTLTKNAGYLTGLTICQQLASGYSVSGIAITNPGSGYSSVFKPKVIFSRASGDLASGNASGLALMNQQSYIYDFGSTWSLATGYSTELVTNGAVGETFPTEVGTYSFSSEDDLWGFIREVSAFSGDFNYSGLTTIYYKFYLSPIDYTGNLVARLTMVNEDGTSGSLYVTGAKAYSTDPLILTNDVSYFANSSSVYNFLEMGLT